MQIIGDMLCLYAEGEIVMLCVFTVDDCRKRWKNVRDTHRRERKKEKERCRSGPRHPQVDRGTTAKLWHF